MFWCIDDVLDEATLSTIGKTVASLEFAQGARSAGWHARAVKNNAQALVSAELKAVQTMIVDSLQQHPLIQSSALPKRIAQPLIARYEKGQDYGSHVDDALMQSPTMRSDISVTIFISDSGDYDGGELVIETPAGEDAVKLPAGAAVLYPSTTLHRIEPVKKGTRLVAVTWIQSLVRDAAKREILFDLDQARRAVHDSEGKSAAFDKIAKSYSNLLRQWAEV